MQQIIDVHIACVYRLNIKYTLSSEYGNMYMLPEGEGYRLALRFVQAEFGYWEEQ